MNAGQLPFYTGYKCAINPAAAPSGAFTGNSLLRVSAVDCGTAEYPATHRDDRRNVGPALVAPLAVPVRLAVPDQQHVHRVGLYTRSP